MSLRHDLKVLREPGFYVSVLVSVALVAGLLVFLGTHAHVAPL